jgi:hypothetical protein
MKSIAYYWNDFKKDFKANKWSYIKWGVVGGVIYPILGIVVFLWALVMQGQSHIWNPLHLLSGILLLFLLPHMFWSYILDNLRYGTYLYDVVDNYLFLIDIFTYVIFGFLLFVIIKYRFSLK